ncbi:MAG: hypothetical protein ABI877_04445 [Gemmatimonadaceae bacterium]
MTRIRVMRPWRRGVRLVVAFGIVSGGPLTARGQGGNVKYAPLAAQLPTSVRAAGMGGAWTSGRDADAVFYNPANAGANGIIVGGGRFGSAGTFGHASNGLSFGATGISLGVAWLDYGAAPGPGVPWRSLAARGADDGFSALAVAAASMTFKGIRWGAAAKLLEERIANSHDGIAAFDFGAAKEFGPYSTGVAVQNVAGSIDVRGVPMYAPTRFTLGASGGGRPVGPVDLGASVAVAVRRDGFVAPAGGFEVSYTPLDGYLFALRIGAHRPEAEAVNPFTAGASMGLDRFTLDYAFADLRAPGRGAVHSVGIRVR